MSSKKLVVVFGATGNQGGSVITSILQDPKASAQFALRGVTRDITKPAAIALTERGVEVVAANMYDKPSLRLALEGAHAVFLVTDFWATVSREQEELQGRCVADVAKELNVKHLIFSSLPNVTELSHGKYTALYHWDSKASIESHIRSLNIPATFFNAGTYMSLFRPGFFFRRTASLPPRLVAAFPVPTHRPIFPLFSASTDTGKYVKGILLHPSQTLGQRIFGCSGWWSLEQILAEFKEALPLVGNGAEVKQVSISQFKEVLGSIGMPEAVWEDMTQNLLWMEEFGYFNGASEDLSREILDEPLTTWKEYVEMEKAFRDPQ